jgi:nitrate/nitrite transporter NarK
MQASCKRLVVAKLTANFLRKNRFTFHIFPLSIPIAGLFLGNSQDAYWHMEVLT